MKRELTVKLSCAVLLIVSSIALASYQTVYEKDIAGGVLMYIAQAFLLAGSIFGLDYYVPNSTSTKVATVAVVVPHSTTKVKPSCPRVTVSSAGTAQSGWLHPPSLLRGEPA